MARSFKRFDCQARPSPISRRSQHEGTNLDGDLLTGCRNNRQTGSFSPRFARVIFDLLMLSGHAGSSIGQACRHIRRSGPSRHGDLNLDAGREQCGEAHWLGGDRFSNAETTWDEAGDLTGWALAPFLHDRILRSGYINPKRNVEQKIEVSAEHSLQGQQSMLFASRSLPGKYLHPRFYSVPQHVMISRTKAGQNVFPVGNVGSEPRREELSPFRGHFPCHQPCYALIFMGPSNYAMAPPLAVPGRSGPGPIPIAEAPRNSFPSSPSGH